MVESRSPLIPAEGTPMYKTICITAAILLAALTLTSGSHPANASRSVLLSPTIVAQGKLPNQTKAIPETDIFTPALDGLFRVSAYATVTKTAGSGSWTYSLEWTDDAGRQLETFALQQSFNQPGQFLTDSSNTGGVVRTFEAKAGTPIMYNVGEAGRPDGSEYSLYYVVEQLE